MSSKSTEDKILEEPREELPVGHPQAGYVEPDLSYVDHVGILPPEEKERHDELVENREEQVEEIEKHETEVAVQEREDAEKQREEEIERWRKLDPDKLTPQQLTVLQQIDAQQAASKKSAPAKPASTSN